MGTNLAATTIEAFATMRGTRYTLSITQRVRDTVNVGENSVSGEQLDKMTAHTLATWQRVMQAVLNGSYEIAPDKDGKRWPSAEEKHGVKISEEEPFITVWNKQGGAVHVTVHSWDNGYYALETAKDLLRGVLKFQEYAKQFGFESFEVPALPSWDAEMAHELSSKAPAKAAPAAPAQTKQPDINNVDDYIPPYAQKAVQRHNENAQAPKTAQVKAFVRPAMKGSLPSTLKLQKGAKGKETWEMAIVPDKPYSSNAADFQEKDLLAYPIMGAIRYEGSSNGFYFVVPVPNSEIRIYQRESTNHNGQLIESDSQKLIKHLGVTGELIQGMKWEVPATHIALKVGKTGDKGQFKNYQGFYELN